MHGRALLLSRVLVLGALAWLVAGCEPPRIKSKESIDSATLTNPPRDFMAAPLDPYSYGGIAGASGGRDPKVTYGAMAPGPFEGADAIYRVEITREDPILNHSDEYLVPDPNGENLTGQYLGSSYLDNEGKKVADVGLQRQMQFPPRAGTTQPVAAH